MQLEMKPEIKLGFYRHFKGTIYQVFGIVLEVDSDEWYVEYGKTSRDYVRSFKRFSEEVEVDGKFIPRYQYLGEQNQND